MRKQKNRKLLPIKSNNIWNPYDFSMCGIGEKCLFWARVKHIKRCLKWSKQRIVRGYSDADVWNMCGYLQTAIPDMLRNLKENHHSSSAFLGENHKNEKGYLVNDTCHAEWDKILEQMIFLWRETKEESCSKKNPYEKEYSRSYREFTRKYGFLGRKLQTSKELEENRKRGGGSTVHFMDEIPEYKEISDRYYHEERELEHYRNQCKDKAMDMMKEYFFSLWD